MTDVLTQTSAARKVAEESLQWRLSGTNNPARVIPKRNWDDDGGGRYNLKGTALRKFLQWEEQTWGINLGWTDDAEPATATRVTRWFFTRNGSSRSPLRYGETVAMGYGINPSFLRYGERPVGINLNWSSSPVYEWHLLGGRTGQPVQIGKTPLAIFNTKAKNFLIHFDRTVGGDIGWPDSRTWGDQLMDHVTFENAVKLATTLYPLV